MTDGKTRVGLMGFGRIGRNVFRQLESHPRIEVAAIADIADPKALVYLLKYDSVFGRFPKKVALDDAGNLKVDGRIIPMLQARDPGDVDWKAYGVEVVVQATRKHRTAADCRKHLDKGAKRVILASTPEDPADMDTLIMGVNDEVLGPEDTIVALGSNTSNAVAPVLKVLLDRFGVGAFHHGACPDQRRPTGRRPRHLAAGQPLGGGEHHPRTDQLPGDRGAGPARPQGQDRRPGPERAGARRLQRGPGCLSEPRDHRRRDQRGSARRRRRQHGAGLHR
jgi:hypothetical protein